MTIAEVKDYLANLTSHVTFCYNGYDCGIDPLATDEFSMWYGNDELTVDSIDKVMNILSEYLEDEEKIAETD